MAVTSLDQVLKFLILPAVFLCCRTTFWPKAFFRLTVFYIKFRKLALTQGHLCTKAIQLALIPEREFQINLYSRYVIARRSHLPFLVKIRYSLHFFAFCDITQGLEHQVPNFFCSEHILSWGNGLDKTSWFPGLGHLKATPLCTHKLTTQDVQVLLPPILLFS